MKKRSGGNPEQLSQLEPIVIFLDETLQNCQPVLSVLGASGITCKRHGSHFNPGTPDEQWLQKVGEEQWILLTHDQRIRYNELQIQQVVRYKIREFVFTSGNLTGTAMAEVLANALPRIKRIIERFEPPFIACISKSGAVEVRFDKHGPIQSKKSKT